MLSGLNFIVLSLRAGPFLLFSWINERNDFLKRRQLYTWSSKGTLKRWLLQWNLLLLWEPILSLLWMCFNLLNLKARVKRKDKLRHWLLSSNLFFDPIHQPLDVLWSSWFGILQILSIKWRSERNYVDSKIPKQLLWEPIGSNLEGSNIFLLLYLYSVLLWLLRN